MLKVRHDRRRVICEGKRRGIAENVGPETVGDRGGGKFPWWKCVFLFARVIIPTETEYGVSETPRESGHFHVFSVDGPVWFCPESGGRTSRLGGPESDRPLSVG